LADIRQDILREIATQLSSLGVAATFGMGADVTINATFLDASWRTGKKKITFEASVFLDEVRHTAVMWQLTREVSSGFSFGVQSERWHQKGKTLYRMVKATQFGPDGKAYQYELDLGAITQAVEKSARLYGWAFETALRRETASYPQGFLPQGIQPLPPPL
jgi:hypothetical protein